MFIDLDGARIFFDVVGAQLAPSGAEMVERSTLLALHGGPGFDHSTQRPHFDRYSDAFQVIYLDHRGNGRSTGAMDTLTLDRWADDIADFCAALGIERPVVLGQSFGGMVAMHYAARHPEGPSKLILSSTEARHRVDAMVDMMRQLGGVEAATVAEAFFTDPVEALHEAYERICLPLYTQTRDPSGADFRARAIQKPEVGRHFFQNEMAEMDLRQELARITCPTLVLAGALDPVTPVVCSQEIVAAIGGNARLEVLTGCGHGVHRDDPDGAERVTRAFLSA